LLAAAGTVIGAWSAGRQLDRLNSRERLQICAGCHGECGNSKIETMPSPAGQPALFLTNQLILMREVCRSEVMEPFVVARKDDEIVAPVDHYSRLVSAPSDEAGVSEMQDGVAQERGRERRSFKYPGYAGGSSGRTPAPAWLT
jgi:cytochrome c553